MKLLYHMKIKFDLENKKPLKLFEFQGFEIF